MAGPEQLHTEHGHCTLPDGAVLHYDVGPSGRSDNVGPTGRSDNVGPAGPAGQRPPLVLISGLGGTSAFWKPMAHHLMDRFTVLSFDQRGIGASTRGTAPCTIDGMAADAMAVIDHVFPDQPVAIMGHSTGGAIAQVIGAAVPDRVSAMVLSGTWLEADGYMRALFAFRREMLAEAPAFHDRVSKLLSFTPDRDRDAPDFWSDLAGPGAAPSAEASAVFHERVAALLAFSGRDIAARLTMPCAVIGARDDRVVPYYHQRDVHDAVPGSDLHTLDAGGHFYPRSRTAETAAFVAEWLAGRKLD